ncbi:MAG: helix-turn-helix domain-containing protein [Nitrososphaeraceae archaeon]|jgi:predicted transcriptional regulator
MFDGYDMHTLLLVVVSFFCGVAIILSYKAVKFFKHNNNSLKNAIIDNKIRQYANKLHLYDEAIAELKAKVDMLELSERTRLVSRDIDSTKGDSERDIDMMSQDGVIIEGSREKPVPSQTRTYLDTLEQILLLLREKPMTTRQIQERVRKTREHTSRIMNGLYHSGFVMRDTSSKPFKYSITETGLRHLRDLHSDLNATTRTEQDLESV